jgi:hypothetical protein
MQFVRGGIENVVESTVSKTRLGGCREIESKLTYSNARRREKCLEDPK